MVTLYQGQTLLFPPGGPRQLVCAGLWPDSAEQPLPITLLGEVGSGLTSFMRWFRKEVERLHDPPLLWIATIPVEGDGPEVEQKLGEQFWEYLQKELPGFAGAAFPLSVMLASFALHKSRRPLLVILPCLSAFSETGLLPVLSRIRGMVESQRLPGVRVLLLGRDDRLLRRDDLFSAFAGIGETFRMPHFTEEEIRGLCQLPNRADATESGAQKLLEGASAQVATACLEWTGGQPLLVQYYLWALHEQLAPTEDSIFADAESPPSTAISPELLEKTGRWLVDHPPPAVRHWQQQLATIVTREEAQARFLDQLLNNPESTDAPVDSLPLFMAGWVRQPELESLPQPKTPETPQSETPKAAKPPQPAPSRPQSPSRRRLIWRITSRAHREWGLLPLRSPERFLRHQTAKRG